MRERRHAIRVMAVLSAVALLALGACTNDDSDGGSASEDDSTGITDDTIKIGFPYFEQEALVEAGLVTDLGDITAVAQGIVDDWNANDGINGRQVELILVPFGTDIANFLAEMQSICLELTEDEQVFAMLAWAWFGDAATCVAGDHDTPLLTLTSMPSTVLASGDGNIFLANFMWEDALASSVRVVDEAGELDDDAVIGVFAPLEPGMREAVDNGLVPALEAVDAEIAVDGSIPFGNELDPAAVSAVVSRFKSEGVDTVFATGSVLYNGAFMTEAQAQNYQPTYVLSDLSEGTDDILLRFAPAEQLVDAIGASWKGKLPDPVPTEEGQECLDAYAPDARGSVTQEVGAAQTCELFDLLRKGLEGAGDSPTRASFIEALEGIGTFTTVGGGEGSFGPDDHRMPDQVRFVRFDLSGCECWVVEGDWIDVHG